MKKDALGAHAREELGISEITTARPIQAAFTSAATFIAGALLPLLTCLFLPAEMMTIGVSAVSLISLGLLGALGAKTGGANVWIGTLRVLFWGALAMGITSIVGKFFGGIT